MSRWTCSRFVRGAANYRNRTKSTRTTARGTYGQETQERNRRHSGSFSPGSGPSSCLGSSRWLQRHLHDYGERYHPREQRWIQETQGYYERKSAYSRTARWILPSMLRPSMNTTSLFRNSGWKSPVMAFGPQPRNRLLCVPYPLCENELLLTVVFVCSGYRLGGASFLSSTITARVRGLSIREELYTVIYKSPIYVFYLAVNIRFLTTM
jgi:hypothetical protein